MRKTRADSFFGMHFDFHAGTNQHNIGENCNPELIEKMIKAVRPDYIQCDTKGHVGATSYPTKVGYPAPKIKADILKMWRDVTAENGIALYAHHSGVWDNSAVAHNPEWAAVNADGIPSDHITSVFGPYADKLLIPQLCEIANEWGLDGAWIDGECWAVTVDYSSYARDAYRKKFGEEPPKPSDENYGKYLEFNRDGFRDYVRHYVDEVHKAAPGFQIASNWLYTSFDPEEAVLPVDFISGDYSPNDSVNTARFEGRCLVNQGKPWDLMAWCFNMSNNMRCIKEYEQMCQEAAAIISLGGGFQFYNTQRIGSIQEWAIPLWSELAKFCRARQETCHKSTPVPQVGIVYSSAAYLHNKKDLFTCYSCPYVDDMRGVLYAVLDSGYSTEILMTHQILNKKSISDYGVIIVTDACAIEPELTDKLLEYVKEGGSLLIAGYNSTELFKSYLSVSFNGGSAEPTAVYIDYNKKMAPVRSPYRDVLPVDAETLGSFCFTDDTDGESKTAATVVQYGKGKIAGIYFSAGDYRNNKTPVMRDFIGYAVRRLFCPAVEIFGTHDVEVSLMKKSGKLCVNLLNLGGMHSDSNYKTFEKVPEIPSFDISIAFPHEPSEVKLEPDGTPVDFRYEDSKIKATLRNFHIHSVVTVI